MDLSAIPFPIFIIAGAVIAAFVTGLLNLTTLIVSKEDKVSDARQKWLQGLRNEMAKLLAVIDTLIRLVEPKTHNKTEGLTAPEILEFREDQRDLYKELNEMQFRVLLRLDPTEHKDLSAKISKLTNAFYGRCTPNDIENVRTLQAAIVTDTQVVIKTTWGRFKQGESAFKSIRRTLQIALVVVALGFVLTAFFWYGARSSPSAQAPGPNAAGPASAPTGGAKSP